MAVDAEPGADRWDVVAPVYGSSPIGVRLAEALVESAAVRPGESVIDIGTANALALPAVLKASGTGTVLGLDRSLGMLNVGAQRLAAAGWPDARLVRADAAHLPVRDASFDVALAGSVWQFLGYALEPLREWRRVLRPGGRLAFSVPGTGSGLSVPVDLIAKYQPRQVQASPVVRPDAVEAASDAGFTDTTVVTRTWTDTLAGPEEWWGIQWTHAVRFFLQGLEPDALDALKAEAFDRLPRDVDGAVIVTTRAVHCVARR